MAARCARVGRTFDVAGAGVGTIAGSTGGVAVGSEAGFFLTIARLTPAPAFGLVEAGTAGSALLAFVALAGATDGTSGKGAGSGLGAPGLASAAGTALVERLDRPVAERWLGAARLAVGRTGSSGAVGLGAIAGETALTLVAFVLTGFAAGVLAGFAVATARRLGRAEVVAGRAIRVFFNLSASAAAAAGAAMVFAGATLAATFAADPPVAGLRAARLAFAGGRASDLPGIGAPTELLARVVLRLEAEVLFVCGFMAPLGWGG